MTRCFECREDVKINYPYGKNSRSVEIGHTKDCKHNIANEVKRRGKE